MTDVQQTLPLTGIPLRPHFTELPEAQEQAELFFRSVARRLEELLQTRGTISLQAMRQLRLEFLEEARSQLGPVYQPASLAVSILCDLVNQGWKVWSADDGVRIERPNPGGNRTIEKQRVRDALLVARDEQLSEPAVQSFIRFMEVRRSGPRGWFSIYSLMRDGADLAAALKRGLKEPAPDVREQRLGQAIQPYLQFVTEDARCEWTGLRLADIWRYFRYTWLNPARSTPGRMMMILVRDAAVAPHPVIGIAALSSSIVQQSERDRWIGWDRDTALQRISDDPSEETAAWLLRSFWDQLNGIQREDFLKEGLLTPQEIREPIPEVIIRLREFGAAERAKHQVKARQLEYKQLQATDNWAKLVKSHLYRSKRALALADLLEIRAVFMAAGFTDGARDRLRVAMTDATFRNAVARVVRYSKAARVGINMMDISVAGALAPYNALLGGKLVSLLLASPEVRNECQRRYGNMPSVIASGMRGVPVIRPPHLVLLSTTGLFSGGSSQYNRIRMPAAASSGNGSEGEIRYFPLDQETSYSTFHFSQATMREMRIYSEQWHNGSEVHGIFGEGTNPKMRKIRESLDRIGFPSDQLLQSGSPRALYMVPLASNFREVLLGRDKEPHFILPDADPRAVTEQIVSFWRRRWLSHRVTQPAVLDQVAKHTLTYPMLHGAAVRLPEPDDVLLEDGEQLDFEDLFANGEADEE